MIRIKHISSPVYFKCSRVSVLLFMFSFIVPLFLVKNIDAKPSRIVSMNLCSDELVLRLADRQRIAAVTKSALIPYISSVVDLAKGMNTTTGTLEEILILDPDLVITGRYDSQKINILKKLGINVMSVGIPKSFNDLKRNIQEIADAVEEKERGEALIKDMEDRLRKIQAQRNPPIDAVFYRTGGLTAPEGSIINDMMVSAGVNNIATQFSTRSTRYIELENLIIGHPDLIIFSDYKTDVPTVRRELLSHPAIKKGFPGLKSVYLPSQYLICGSPATINATEILSQYIQDNMHALLVSETDPDKSGPIQTDTIK